MPPTHKANGCPSVSQDLQKTEREGSDGKWVLRGSTPTRGEPGCPDDPVSARCPPSQLWESQPESGQLLPIVRWFFLVPRLGPRKGERERNVFADSVGREQLSDALGYCSFFGSCRLPWNFQPSLSEFCTRVGRRAAAVIPVWQGTDSERRNVALKYGS